MKTKIFKYLIVFLIIFTIFYFFCKKDVVYASQSNGEEKLNNTVDEEVERLNTDALQDFFDELNEDEKTLFSADVKKLLKSLIDGENDISFADVANLVLKYVAQSVVGFMPALIAIMIISILYGVLSGLNSGFLNESTNKIVYFACYGSALVILLNEVVSLINITVTTATKLGGLMEAVFPIMLTLMTALGGINTVGIIKPLMAVVATFIISFISKFILPCFAAAVILAVVGNLSPTVKFNKLSLFFRKIAEWSLGLIFGLFIAILTTRGIVGRTADGVAVNAAKFAIGSYVPILGGYISDGFDVVMAGCILIKNAVGVTGLIVMLSILMLPVVKLIIFTLALRFAAAVTEPAGAGNISDLLQTVSISMRLLISSLLGIAFMFFAVILLVISSCNLGVI